MERRSEVLRKGAIMRLFGIILIFIGALDAMLSWRGGIALSGFYVLLMGSGVLFYAAGSIRRGGEGSKPGPRERPPKSLASARNQP